MHRKIIYLINPISGTKEKSTLQEIIIKKTRDANIPFEILPTSKIGDYTDIRDRIINDKVTDIITCGGDGTISSVASALMDLDVRFGIILMGSGNGLALAAKNPGSTYQGFRNNFQGKIS